MHYEYGYAEETELGKPYDLKLLRRMIPYVKKYKRLLMYSILLVIMIILMELALPYVTKIAIDQYIVPKNQFINMTLSDPDGEIRDQRVVQLDLENDAVKDLVQQYEDLFLLQDNMAVIRYRDYLTLNKEELIDIHKTRLSGLGIILAVFVVLILLNFGFDFLQILVMAYTSQKIMHDLRIQLYSHIQGLSLNFFSKNPTGRLVTRVTNDVQNMQELFTSIVSFLFEDLFLLVGIAVVLLAINLELALICFIVLPFVIYASLRFSRQAREAFRSLRIKVAEINTRFSETIIGMKIIQLFLQEHQNYLKFKALNHEHYQAGMRQVHIFALFMPTVEFLGMIALATVIWYGGGNVVKNTMSLGELVAFITYMKMFFRPIRDIAEKYNIMQNAMASSERIFLILDTDEKDGNGSSRQNLVEATPYHLGTDKIHTVSFQNVSFEYIPREPVLKDISFTLKSDESIAFVGPTGSGKTTLINLLLRFYSPIQGRILINDMDSTSFDLSYIRSKISVVMQDPFLFSGTIRDNIIYGNPEMTSAQLNRILAMSNLTDLVKRLPEGINTILTEGGSSISSGERQLIAIARAFSRNSDLIIFDEATSYVDSETEFKIQEALAKLKTNRTSITVAHRLTTAKDADRIIVLNKGKIIETGSHAELMRQGGFYYKLHQLQN